MISLQEACQQLQNQDPADDNDTLIGLIHDYKPTPGYRWFRKARRMVSRAGKAALAAVGFYRDETGTIRAI